MRVSIGLINQEAQASASVPEPEQYTYYSNLTWPLNNYEAVSYTHLIWLDLIYQRK